MVELISRNKYDSAEWSQAVATNYDVYAQTLFSNCKQPSHVVIRVDTAITVKFDSTSNSAITVAANTAFELTNFTFNKIYITTSGTTAVKIFMSQTTV